MKAGRMGRTRDVLREAMEAHVVLRRRAVDVANRHSRLPTDFGQQIAARGGLPHDLEARIAEIEGRKSKGGDRGTTAASRDRGAPRGRSDPACLSSAGASVAPTSNPEPPVVAFQESLDALHEYIEGLKRRIDELEWENAGLRLEALQALGT